MNKLKGQNEKISGGSNIMMWNFDLVHFTADVLVQSLVSSSAEGKELNCEEVLMRAQCETLWWFSDNLAEPQLCLWALITHVSCFLFPAIYEIAALFGPLEPHGVMSISGKTETNILWLRVVPWKPASSARVWAAWADTRPDAHWPVRQNHWAV